MTEPAIHDFQETVWDYYRLSGRHDLPWRQPAKDGHFDPYAIVVSELMLQQTQVSRVIPKFEAFMAQFPSVGDLAAAPLADVLVAWSGLGYNRRAKFLWQTAIAVTQQHDGHFPDTLAGLVSLPGIGPNTAGAVLAYAYNQPVAFIETNIRSIFIYHFFSGQTAVPDRDLVPFIQASVPPHEARDWYWALMDYGTYLKQTIGNVSRHSTAYVRQSTFEGSRRQIRGKVLKLLGGGSHSRDALHQQIADDRLDGVLQDLLKEGFIALTDTDYHLMV
jgi:A/G-specific adenine glycosylase